MTNAEMASISAGLRASKVEVHHLWHLVMVFQPWELLHSSQLPSLNTLLYTMASQMVDYPTHRRDTASR